MIGLSTLLFAAGLLVALMLVYTLGMPGWITGASVLVGGWIGLAIWQGSDPAILAVQALTAALVLWFGFYWTLRHRAWQARTTKDRGEAEERQLQVQAIIQDLRDKISAKAAEV